MPMLIEIRKIASGINLRSPTRLTTTLDDSTPWINARITPMNANRKPIDAAV